MIAQLRTQTAPPLLVMSLPRSGSSWVGAMLALSADVAYLREPINQFYLARNGSPSVFQVESGSVPKDYVRAAQKAFRGIPAFPNTIVRKPDQWTLVPDKPKRVLVKETNPLALEWMLDRFAPQLIYLVRHPVAVASSYHTLGWTGKQIEPRFTPSFLASLEGQYEQFEGDFWAEHGAMQAIVHNIVDRAVSRYEGRALTVTYEDLCADPEGGFRALYDFAGLDWTDAVERGVRRNSRVSEHDRDQAYSTKRDSEAMQDAWKKDTDPEQVRRVRAGYMHFDPPHYRAEW